MTLEEEYLLMDFYALVAAIGGSMGIFLGWSILGGADKAISTIRKSRIGH